MIHFFSHYAGPPSVSRLPAHFGRHITRFGLGIHANFALVLSTFFQLLCLPAQFFKVLRGCQVPARSFVCPTVQLHFVFVVVEVRRMARDTSVSESLRAGTLMLLLGTFHLAVIDLMILESVFWSLMISAVRVISCTRPD
jgi:hypothetical protein